MELGGERDTRLVFAREEVKRGVEDGEGLGRPRKGGEVCYGSPGSCEGHLVSPLVIVERSGVGIMAK